MAKPEHFTKQRANAARLRCRRGPGAYAPWLPALRAAVCVALYLVCSTALPAAARYALALAAPAPAQAEAARGILLAVCAAASSALPLAVAAIAWGLPLRGLRLRCASRSAACKALAAYPLVLLCASVPLSALAGRLWGYGPAAVLPATWPGRAAAAVQLCLVCPLAEELLFRGGVQGLLAPYGPGAAICGQAALFAALHGSAPQAAFALPMGLLFGWAARRCGGLGVPLALHMLNNILMYSGLL